MQRGSDVARLGLRAACALAYRNRSIPIMIWSSLSDRRNPPRGVACSQPIFLPLSERQGKPYSFFVPDRPSGRAAGMPYPRQRFISGISSLARRWSSLATTANSMIRASIARAESAELSAVSKRRDRPRALPMTLKHTREEFHDQESLALGNDRRRNERHSWRLPVL